MFQGDTAVDLESGPFTLERALLAAKEESGLKDFGDTGFLEPLEVLIDCVNRDLSFTAAGEINFRGSVQRLLANRLRVQRDLSAHPEILSEDVSDPIMILGMPRTGTTKLQRLLSADPQFQGLPLWQLLNPAPFAEEVPGDPVQRIAFAKMVEDATRANADFTTSHETAALEVDEDSYLLLMTFEYPLLYSLYPSSSYLSWVRDRDRLPPHQYEMRLLQYLQWQNEGRQGRRWVLKNPGAVGCLSALKETFPGITFVHSHRDMQEVMPSYCRLMEAALNPLLEVVDPIQHGRNSLDFWSHEMARYSRDRTELADKLNIIDVPYLDLVKNPMALVKDIYTHCALTFSDAALESMRKWEQANQQHKHGKARYSLKQYGLNAEQIDAAFVST